MRKAWWRAGAGAATLVVASALGRHRCASRPGRRGAAWRLCLAAHLPAQHQPPDPLPGLLPGATTRWAGVRSPARRSPPTAPAPTRPPPSGSGSSTAGTSPLCGSAAAAPSTSPSRSSAEALEERLAPDRADLRCPSPAGSRPRQLSASSQPQGLPAVTSARPWVYEAPATRPSRARVGPRSWKVTGFGVRGGGGSIIIAIAYCPTSGKPWLTELVAPRPQHRSA